MLACRCSTRTNRITRVDETAFEVGRNLAVTPGSGGGLVCTENVIRVADVMESPKLAE